MERRKTPALQSLDDLRGRIGYAQEHAQKTGRTAPLEIVFGVGAPGIGTAQFNRDRVLEQIDRLRAIGVSYLTANVPGETRSEQAQNIAQFGEEVLSRI